MQTNTDYLKVLKEKINKIYIAKYGDANEVNFSVDIPELERGDATTNLCLIASKVLNMSPMNVGNSLVEDLRKLDFIESVTCVAPGFINFSLKTETIRNILNPKKTFFSFFKKSDIRYNTKYSGKNVLVEHSSPNLFKPFTIGHLMNNFTGEFLVRILRHVGAEVKTISYPSDISIGIAKAIYILKQDKKNLEELEDVVKYLGECYVRGVSEYKKWEEGGSSEKIVEVKQITNNLFNKIESEDLKIFEQAKKINLDYLFGNLKNLGSSFDGFIFESEAGEVGKKIVLENTGDLGNDKIFKKSEGAVVYIPNENRKDINTTVFINSEGNPTYAGKDIGLLSLKFEKYPNIDFSFYVTDNEQSAHFKTVFAAAGGIKKEWEEKSVHVPHGRMTFKGEKMSSRLGGVPLALDVIDAVFDDVREKSGGNENDNIVAMSALRVSVLRSKPGSNIDFDPVNASSFEGDSGPYLCYTHARANSILEKAAVQNLFPKVSGNFPVNNLERKILHFKNILEISAEEIAPQKLVKYLFELAGVFNSFYNQEKIIVINDKIKTEHNLYLTKKLKETLSMGLNILGIDAPDKM